MKDTKLLIVDDEAVFTLLLKRIFRKLGYHVCEPVATGEAAIQAALQEKPDVVLMDIRLVGPMDGVAAATRILESHQVPIIFMTGYADEATENRARALKPAALLTKPVTPEDILPVLNTLFPPTGTDRIPAPAGLPK